MEKRFEFQATVWLHPGQGGWHFVSLSTELSERIKESFGGLKRAWGSLAVNVEIGGDSWRSSLFPDSKRGCYLLPLSVEARRRGPITAGDEISVIVEIVPKLQSGSS